MEELYDNYIENNHESNDIKKERKDYLGIGTLIAAVAGTSFVAGKKIEKRKRE